MSAATGSVLLMFIAVFSAPRGRLWPVASANVSFLKTHDAAPPRCPRKGWPAGLAKADYGLQAVAATATPRDFDPEH